MSELPDHKPKKLLNYIQEAFCLNHFFSLGFEKTCVQWLR